MRFLSLLLSILLLSGFINAQKRYLISPNQEVIPIDKYSSAAAEIAKRVNAQKAVSSVSDHPPCTNKFIFGYTMDVYPLTSNFGAYHKDVMGQWYVAKASGTIDTFYFYAYNLVGAKDSILWLRIHESNIGPSYGPGIGAYAAYPPCQNWGYWKTTNDADNGVG
ncbi:MAG: hypothetical protein HY800_04920, partial [Ignavibacteriales bacterium]|nr:hypothetical protein [Ignavibacteriales bacterium]